MAATFPVLTSRPSVIPSGGYTFICHICRRNKSTYGRARKALKIKPDPSFLPSLTERQDHIIFNPPSSTPNVYHTPLKFLPKTDPRRQLHSFEPTSSSTSLSTPSSSHLSNRKRSSSLPPIRQPYEKKYHLGPDQIAEIRKLRAEDPRKWTRVRLAEKFQCSQFFISLCCCAPEIKQEQDRELAEIKKRWGRRKTEAREERQARKALWGRDV